MEHQTDLIFTLAGGLTAALLFGTLTHRLRLSPIVGYLIAGLAVGPFTPGFVAHAEIANQLAEVGVILLMFGVGLQFHLKELLAVRRVAIPGALVQIAVATGLGVLITRSAGWSLGGGVVFGLAISVASTVVLLRVLSDHGQLHTPSGHVAVGWLVVEDLFTVLVLVLLPALAGNTGESPNVLAVTSIAVLKLGAMLVFTLLVGQKLIPKFLEYVARTQSRELFTLTILVVALGIAVGAAKVFGASMALGAFLAGVVVGQSDFSSRAASDALPMRDAFAVLFFVSVGMMVDPAALFANVGLTLAAIAVVVIGKPVAAYAVVKLLRYPTGTALAVAVALAQIGEFSFILGVLGEKLGLLPPAANQALVAAAIVSITLNPLLFGLVERVTRKLEARASLTDEGPAPWTDSEQPRAIVVGYGPVGRMLTKILQENGIAPVVIELNIDAVRAINAAGGRAVYGDAMQAEILEQAGVHKAASLVFAGSGSPPEPIVRVAKQLNPNIRILARAQYVGDLSKTHDAGADVVVTAEAEVAIAMAERMLTALGATGEQLDRIRDRVRREIVLPQPT